ncbi:MAG: hypothetical protein JNK78_03190, partial [Planctomycetes bacterium]|nr:hypothetical protein [Planctomycetota bacterium]
MQRQNIVLLVGSLLLSVAAAIVIPQAFQSDDPSPMRWTEADEQVIADDADANVATTATLDSTERTAGEAAQALAPDEARVAVLLRGRVVDRFQRPVSAAQVWLDFGRAGARGGPMARQRRVPDPVQTDEQGRFAFAGQTFRNLQVALQVLHETHAPGVFDKFVGEVRSHDGASEIDLGDLVLTQGGELVGRVTDLEGNGIPGADLELQAENGNPMRMVRD